MGDGRVREHALESVWVTASTAPTSIVAMATAHSIGPPVRRSARQRDVKHSQEGTERGDLGRGGHEAGDRRGGALVDVRDPRMERHRTDFEQQARPTSRPTPISSERVSSPFRPSTASAIPGEMHRARIAVQQGDAEERRTPRRKRRAESTSSPLPARAAGGGGRVRTAGTAAAKDLERDEHGEQVVATRGRAACRRSRTGPAGNTSVWVTPASVASRSATLPGNRGGLGCECVDAPGRSRARRVPGAVRSRPAFGDEHDGQQRRPAGSCPAGTSVAPSTATAPAARVDHCGCRQQRRPRRTRRPGHRD